MIVPRVLLLAVVGLGVAGVLLRHVRVPYASTEQREYNRNVGELTGDREVGQLFASVRPFLSGVGFQVATYGGRENTADVVFELRERPEDAEPLRQVTVNAREFRDHQRATFAFPPIRESAGKTYYASLRSPAAVPGNAITVDYSNKNPYRKGTGSSMVVLPAARKNLRTFAGTVKPDADTAFAVIHRITAWEAARLLVARSVRGALTSVRDHPGESWTNARFFLVALVFSAGALGLRRFRAGVLLGPRVLPIVVGVLVALGLVLRLLYVEKLPYTNDEGSYLYDARTVLAGRLPGGDGLAKAPVVVAAFAGAVFASGAALSAARWVSVLAGIATALPLAVLGHHLGRARNDPAAGQQPAERRSALLAGQHAGLLTALLWLLASAPALFHAYGHTQPLQVFLGTAGLAALAVGVRRQRSLSWLLASGVLLGLGVAARKSTLALGVPALLLLLLDPVPWRVRRRRTLQVGAGFFVAVAAFLVFVSALYGGAGVRYATGIDLAKTSLEQLGERGDLYATYSVRGVLPFFRESLPLILLALVALGGAGERLLRRFAPSIARLGWALPLLLAWRGGEFLRAHEESVHFSYGLWGFWITMIAALGLLAVLPRRGATREVFSDRPTPAILAPLAWFLAVGVFYAFWIKFHANYLLEFLPALTLFAAVGAQQLAVAFSRARVLPVAFGGLLLWGAMTASLSGYHFEHTGTFHRTSIGEAADVLRARVPPEEPVLTGAVIIPYLSGHRTLFDVAHPTWYGYGFIEPELRNVFTAPHERLVETVVQDVRWVVRERLTDFSYFREYPDSERVVEEKFRTVAEIENLSNPIRILERAP